jgi:hypothetical protein
LIGIGTSACAVSRDETARYTSHAQPVHSRNSRRRSGMLKNSPSRDPGRRFRPERRTSRWD